MGYGTPQMTIYGDKVDNKWTGSGPEVDQKWTIIGLV